MPRPRRDGKLVFYFDLVHVCLGDGRHLAARFPAVELPGIGIINRTMLGTLGTPPPSPTGMANADDSGNSAPGNSTVSTRIPERLDLGQTPLIRGCVAIDLLAGKLSGAQKSGLFFHLLSE